MAITLDSLEKKYKYEEDEYKNGEKETSGVTLDSLEKKYTQPAAAEPSPVEQAQSSRYAAEQAGAKHNAPAVPAQGATGRGVRGGANRTTLQKIGDAITGLFQPRENSARDEAHLSGLKGGEVPEQTNRAWDVLRGIAADTGSNYSEVLGTLSAVEAARGDVPRSQKGIDEGRVYATPEENQAAADYYFDQSDRWYRAALEAQAQAKEGLGAGGQFAVDAASLLGNVGAQVAANAVVPGLGTIARVFDVAGRSARDYRMNAGEDYDPNKAGIAGAASAAGVAVGGALSRYIGGVGMDKLRDAGLITNLGAHAGVGALSGLGFAAGEIPLSEIGRHIADPTYTTDAKDVLKRAASAAAFGAVSQFLNGLRVRAQNSNTVSEPEKEFEGKWFRKDMTPEEARKLKLQLARQYHPDRGGDTAIMQEINDEYDRLIRYWNNVGIAAHNRAASAKARGDEATYQAASEEYRQAVGFLQEAVNDGIITGEAADAVSVLATIANEGIAPEEIIPASATAAVTGSESALPPAAESIPAAVPAGQLPAAPETNANYPPAVPAEPKNGKLISPPAETNVNFPSAVSTEDANRELTTTQEQAAPAPAPVRSGAEQVAQFGKTLGTAGNTVINGMYSGENSSDYIKGFAAAYNLGRASTGEQVSVSDEARMNAAQLTAPQAEAAFKAGIADARNNLKNSQTRGIIEPNNLNGGTEYGRQGRDLGYSEGSLWSQQNDAGQRAGGVDQKAEGAGSLYDQRGMAAENGGAYQSQAFRPRAGKDADAGKLVYGREVSARDFSIPGADESRKVRIVESGSTRHTENAKKIAGDTDVTFYGGNYLSAQGNDRIESWSQPARNRMGIAADDPNFTSDRLTGHEKCEILIGRGKIDHESVALKAGEKLTDSTIDDALDIYEYFYPGESREALLKELVCDAAGNMNRIMAYADSLSDFMKESASGLDSVLSAIHDALNEETGGAFALVPELESGKKSGGVSKVAGAASAQTGAGDVTEESIKAANGEIITPAQQRALESYGVKYDKDSDVFTSFSSSTVPTTPEKYEEAVKTMMRVSGKPRNEIEKYLNNQVSIANVILKNRFAMDYERRGDNWLRTNSDYPGGSVDLSNNCPKRKALTDLTTALLRYNPNRLFTAEDVTVMRDVLAKHGYQIDCGPCFNEDRRQLLGEIAQSFIDGVRGNGPLKPKVRALLPKNDRYVPTQYDLITEEGLTKLRGTHPEIADAFIVHNNARGMQAGRLIEGYAEYSGQILGWSKSKVQRLNDKYHGLRMFSSSDAEIPLFMDIMQITTDASMVGLKIQGYSKQNTFLNLIKDTNMNFLRSHIAAGDGWRTENGRKVLVFDPVEGIDFNDPLYKLIPNDSRSIGNNVIGINDTQIRVAMQDPFIDQIIPFHTSVKETILERKHIGHWNNYKNDQREHGLSDHRTDDSYDINFYTDVLDAAAAAGRPIRTKRDFVEKFLAVARQKGVDPRFSQFLNKNSRGEYIYTDGYEKFLVDYKMFDSRGRYIEQQPVVPKFDTEFVTQMLREYASGERSKRVDVAVYNDVAKELGLDPLPAGKQVQQQWSGTEFSTAPSLTENQEENREYNEKQTKVGGRLKTLGGSYIERAPEYGVGKYIGGKLYLHKSYADDVIPVEAYESAQQVLAENYPDFDYNCVEWTPKDNIIRFDQAPRFDEAREPAVGDYVEVKPDGTTRKGHTDYIWHHKWLWVKNDYEGFDVAKAWQWSKRWLSTISGKTYEVNGKQYSDRGKSDGNGIDRWNAQLKAYGLPLDNQTSFSTAPVKQEHTSRGTSINVSKVPALYTQAAKKGAFHEGGINIDIGAGVEDTPATAYLKEQGVASMPFDPFNRNRETNKAVTDYLQGGEKADTATCSNCLNVIDNAAARANVILEMAKSIKPDGTAYFTVYENKKNLDAGKAGENDRKPDQWQEFRSTATYVPEIKRYFDDVPDPKGGLIIARKPKANLPKAVWQLTSTEYTDKEGNHPYTEDETTVFSSAPKLDNRGEKLSKKQQEYFGRTQARDENGNLLRMYHGTDADFTVFETTSGGKNGTAEGFGFYFADTQEVTEHYGSRQMSGYINTVRPATSWKKTIKKSELVSLIKAACYSDAAEMVASGDYDNQAGALRDSWISNYTYTYDKSFDAACAEVADTILRGNGNDMNIVQEVMSGMAIRDYDRAMSFYHYVLTPTIGIDAFWTKWDNHATGEKHNIILTFQSNQFKNADNKEPTGDPDTRFSSAPSVWRDKEYFDALETGDEETQEKIIREAASEAGYTVKAWHQTARDFTAFNTNNPGAALNDSETPNGIFFKTNDHDIGLDGKKQMAVYLNLGRTLDFKNREEANAWYRKNVPGYDELSKQKDAALKPIDEKMESIETQMFSDGTTDEEYERLDAEWNGLLEQMRVEEDKYRGQLRELLNDYFLGDDRKYDSIHLGYDGHRYVDGKRENVETYIVFSNTQAKSADPITYDDNGNVIPPSKRFQRNEDDIRFSRAPSIVKLQEENRELRAKLAKLRGAKKQAEYWKGQTQITEAPTLREGDVAKLAKGILTGYSSTLDAKETTARMKELGEYVARGSDESGELSYEAAKERAVDIARDIVRNAKELAGSYDARIEKEIKSRLRAGVQISEDQARWIGDFNYWRKANFGKINVSYTKGVPVDVLYAELNDIDPSLFPDSIDTQPNQLLRMAEVYDIVGKHVNPHSAYMAEAIEYCANEILDGLIDESVRQTPPTFADRQAFKLQEEKARGQAAVRAAREEGKRKAEDAFLAGQMEQGRRMAEQNRRLQELIAEGRERAAEAIRREREARDKKIQALKEHYAEIDQARRERRADSAARTKLLNIAKRLKNAKLPAANRAMLDEYLADLDTTAKGMTGKTLEKLSELEDWYLDRKENDPDFISDPGIEKSLRRLHDRHISDLTQQEVAELTEILLNIENEIRTERKTIDTEDRRDTYIQGVEAIEDVENSKGSKPGSVVDRFITSELLSPTRELRRVTGYADDDPLYQRAKDLEAGQRKMFDYQRRANERFQRWVDDKRLIRRIAGKDAEEITIQGLGANGPVAVKITPAMRMSLYLHSLNDQNLRHIVGGGITVPDIKLYKQGKIADAYDRGTTIKLTPSQVRAIASHMTAEERAFAEAARIYFNTVSRDEINAVSEKLKGYSLAGVENYFPINTDTSFTKKDFDSVKYDGTVEGMGFTKERVNASNPIMLRDMNAVLTQSIDQHSRYVGLAIPIRNFNKVYGVTKSSFNEDGTRNGFESSVQQAIKKKWGSTATRYIEKMMSDLQNPPNTTSAWGQALAKARSNYARAVLELNGGVAIKQAASYPTAAAVVGWGPLLQALADPRKVDVQTVAKYTPLLWYRAQGYSNAELGDIAKSGKQLPKLLNWIQGMDIATTTELWQAAEYYVRGHNRGLERGTDAFYRAVAEVYNRIIEETQPNYTTMQRPQLLRDESDWTRALNMFKTQPFQNFNILYDAFGNLDAKHRAWVNDGSAENRKAYNEAKTNVAKAVSSQIISAIVFASMQMLWDHVLGRSKKYKDDEDKYTIESVVKGLGFNAATSLGGMAPFGTEVLELGEALFDAVLKSYGKDPFFDQKWYGFDDAVTETLTSTGKSAMSAVVQSITMIQKAMNGDVTDADWESYGRQMLDSAVDLAKFAGIPADNVRKLATSAARTYFVKTEGKYVGGYDALRLTSDPAKYANDYYDLLYDAYRNDNAAYKEIYGEMIDSGRFDADKIKAAMENRMKKAQGVTKASELDARYMNPTEQAKYDAGLNRLRGSSVWRGATETQRDSALDILYGLAVGANDATTKSAREKIAGGKSVGLDETEYILYTIARAMADQPNKNGKLGTYTNAEVEEAIRSISGLSDAERRYLWIAQGQNEKTSPW